MEQGKVKKRRRKPQEGRNKKVVSVSFSGEEGYEALDFASSTDHTLGRSGLLIDLVLLYKQYKDKCDSLGMSDNDFIEFLRKKCGLEQK